MEICPQECEDARIGMYSDLRACVVAAPNQSTSGLGLRQANAIDPSPIASPIAPLSPPVLAWLTWQATPGTLGVASE